MRFNIFSLKSLFISGVGIIIMANNDLNANKLSGSTLSKAVLFPKISNISTSIPPPSSITPKLSRSEKALNRIISHKKIKPLKPKPQEQSTELNFSTIGQITDAFHSLWRYSKVKTEFNPKEIYNPKRISAYYNPAKNEVIVPADDVGYSSISHIYNSDINPLFTIGGIRAIVRYIKGSPFEYISEMLRKTNPVATLIKKTSQQKKALSINGASESERELVTSSSIESQVKILGIGDLNIGEQILSYGDNWIPLLLSMSQEHNKSTYRDIHLFKGIVVSNKSGSSELHRYSGASFLVEVYNSHFLKNPRYTTVPSYSRTLLGNPIYSGFSEVQAFASETQINVLSISNSRPYKDLIISGMLYYNPRTRDGFKLTVLRGSNFENLLDKNFYTLKLHNSNVGNILRYRFDEDNVGFLGKSLKVYEKQSISVRYRGPLTYSHTQEWKLSSLQEHQPNLINSYRIFPAFVEFQKNGLFDTEQYPSLVFPLFENLFVSTSRDKRLATQLSTMVDGNQISKGIPYESVLPLDYNPSLRIKPEFKVGGLLSPGKKVKGTVGLIPQFKNSQELIMFSEHVYFTNKNLYGNKVPFVQISPVVLYHPGNHNIAILESSYLGLAYTTFYREQISLSRNYHFIDFSIKGIRPANITLLSQENFSRLMKASTLLTLRENSYAASSEGFVNPNIWSILFYSVSYNNSNSIVPSPLIGVFKNVTIDGGKFLNRVDFFTKIFSYELLIPNRHPKLS